MARRRRPLRRQLSARPSGDTLSVQALLETEALRLRAPAFAVVLALPPTALSSEGGHVVLSGRKSLEALLPATVTEVDPNDPDDELSSLENFWRVRASGSLGTVPFLWWDVDHAIEARLVDGGRSTGERLGTVLRIARPAGIPTGAGGLPLGATNVGLALGGPPPATVGGIPLTLGITGHPLVDAARVTEQLDGLLGAIDRHLAARDPLASVFAPALRLDEGLFRDWSRSRAAREHSRVDAGARRSAHADAAVALGALVSAEQADDDAPGRGGYRLRKPLQVARRAMHADPDNLHAVLAAERAYRLQGNTREARAMLASLYGKLASLERILRTGNPGIRWLAEEILQSTWSRTGWQALQIDAGILGARRDILAALGAGRAVEVPVRPA